MIVHAIVSDKPTKLSVVVPQDMPATSWGLLRGLLDTPSPRLLLLEPQNLLALSVVAARQGRQCAQLLPSSST
jgi:hypothetical protein